MRTRPTPSSPSSPKGTPVAENPVDIKAGEAIMAKLPSGTWGRGDTLYKHGWCGEVSRIYGSDEKYQVLMSANCNLDSEDAEALADFTISARTGWPAALHELRAAREENGRLRRALKDLLTGISVHNERLRPGKLAEKIEGQVVTAARAALKGAP